MRYINKCDNYDAAKVSHVRTILDYFSKLVPTLYDPSFDAESSSFIW